MSTIREIKDTNGPAFPMVIETPDMPGRGSEQIIIPGMSKREYIATQLMAARVSHQKSGIDPSVAFLCVEGADMLLKALADAK